MVSQAKVLGGAFLVELIALQGRGEKADLELPDFLQKWTGWCFRDGLRPLFGMPNVSGTDVAASGAARPARRADAAVPTPHSTYRMWVPNPVGGLLHPSPLPTDR